MKKILVSSLFASSFSLLIANATFAADELTGDTKLACEAILCLSTGTRPSECGPSIARYFGISFKYWSDTIAARRNFLNLCPTGDQNQALNILKNEVLTNMQTDCTASYLNTRIEQKTFEMKGLKSEIPQGARQIYCEDENYEHKFNKVLNRNPQCKWTEVRSRVNPNLPRYCQVLMEHEYTDKKLTYNCDDEFKLESEFKKDCWVE